MKRIVAVIILLLFVLVQSASYIDAQNSDCTCSTGGYAFIPYDQVFRARVERVLNYGDEHGAMVTKVNTLQGYQNKEIEVFTPSTDAECGLQFKKGEEYVINARIDRQGRIYADTCSKTQDMDTAGAYIDSFGKDKTLLGNKKKDNGYLSGAPGIGSTPGIVAIIVIAGGLLFGVGKVGK